MTLKPSHLGVRKSLAGSNSLTGRFLKATPRINHNKRSSVQVSMTSRNFESPLDDFFDNDPFFRRPFGMRGRFGVRIGPYERMRSAHHGTDRSQPNNTDAAAPKNEASAAQDPAASQSVPRSNVYRYSKQSVFNNGQFKQMETIQENDRLTQKIRDNCNPVQTKTWNLADPEVQEAIKSGKDGPQNFNMYGKNENQATVRQLDDDTAKANQEAARNEFSVEDKAEKSASSVQENFQDQEFSTQAATIDPLEIPRNVIMFYVDLYLMMQLREQEQQELSPAGKFDFREFKNIMDKASNGTAPFAKIDALSNGGQWLQKEVSNLYEYQHRMLCSSDGPFSEENIKDMDKEQFNEAMIQSFERYQGQPELWEHINKVSENVPDLKTIFVRSDQPECSPDLIRRYSSFDDVFDEYFKMFDQRFFSDFQDRQMGSDQNPGQDNQNSEYEPKSMFDLFMDFADEMSLGQVGFLKHRNDPDFDRYFEYLRRTRMGPFAGRSFFRMGW